MKALLFFLCFPVYAQSVFIWNSVPAGSAAGNLTNIVRYNNGVLSIAGSLNPTSSAVNAPAGSMYLSTSTLIAYIKQDSGSSTNWLALGNVSGVASSVDGEVALFNGTSGKSIKRATGTGVAKLTSGVLSVSNVSLTTEVTGVLPLANGGTNKNMTAVAGGIVYTDGDSQEVTAAGTSGQVLTSNGSGAPTWTTVGSGSSFGAYVTGSCSITSQVGGSFFSSGTRGTSGVCTFTMTGLSSVPVCTCSVTVGGGVASRSCMSLNPGSWTTTSIQTATASGGSLTNEDLMITCVR